MWMARRVTHLQIWMTPKLVEEAGVCVKRANQHHAGCGKGRGGDRIGRAFARSTRASSIRSFRFYDLGPPLDQVLDSPCIAQRVRRSACLLASPVFWALSPGSSYCHASVSAVSSPLPPSTIAASSPERASRRPVPPIPLYAPDAIIVHRHSYSDVDSCVPLAGLLSPSGTVLRAELHTCWETMDVLIASWISHLACSCLFKLAKS